MRKSLLLFLFAALTLAPAAALAWSDNFDAYANGSGLIGQGGWQGWDNDASANAFVTNVQARSVPHSMEARMTTDIVQQYTGVNSGQWVISGYVYIPTGIGGTQFFILLNQYQHLGPYNWSLDLQFDCTANLVRDFDNPAVPPLPLIRNQWVQVRVEINFATDTQSIFYGGNLLNQKSWTEGASGGGELNFECLDIFADTGGTIYWDDLDLREAGTTAVEPATWGGVKARFQN
jgi:hypothetical protein